MNYKIEKGIPIKSRKKYPFEDMEVGDSFTAPSAQRIAVRAAIQTRQNLTYDRYTTRSEDNGTIRVWRVK